MFLLARAWGLLISLGLVATSIAGLPAATGAGAAAPRPSTDFVTMDSAPGHGPGEGRSLSWSGGEITSVHAAGAFLDIQTEGGGWNWTFRAPEGQRLRPGSYENADGSMIAGRRPGLLVGGDGSGCNEAHGRFRVLELAADLSRIWILYEHRCQNDDPSLAAWGEIRIGMPDVGPDLTLLPETLRVPAWYPGLDAVAQPVMVFNTGSTPLTVSSAAVTAGETDFSVGGVDGCTDLAPRESCRVLVGFRPSVAGTRTGTLRLTTSAGARDVPLTGYGFPGTTELRLENGVATSYVATPDKWTMSGGAVERRVRFDVREPRYAGDHVDVAFTAPEGGFRAGRTYSTCCTDVGPSMSLGVNGRAIGGTGSFTVHEVAYDAEDELQRFSASFRKHGGTGGWYVGSIAWRATTPPSMPPIPTESDAAPLTIGTDRAAYTSGDVARVTVTVPGGSAGQEVTLYGSRRYGGPYLVGSATTGTTGRAGFDVPLWNETSLSAASGTHVGYAELQLTETPIVAARASGQLRRQGRFLVFRAGQQARFAAAATMVAGSECLYAQVQRKVHRRWRAVSRQCLTVQELTIAEYRVGGRAQEQKRVRFVLPAAGGRPTAASSWIYVEFVRRRR